MNFQSILIVTYGRSGSTLLQGLLNSIDGCLIRGENKNFCFHLYQSYQAILDMKAEITEWNHMADSPRKYWYGARLLDERLFINHISQLVKKLLLADQIDNLTIQCYGFKEVRYSKDKEMAHFIDYLSFLNQIFPNVALIFNIRNLDDVVKSAWLAVQDPNPLKKKLLTLETMFRAYCQHHDNGFIIRYEDVITKSAQLEAMYQFLGATYQPETVDQVLARPHSFVPTQTHVKQLFTDFNDP